MTACEPSEQEGITGYKYAVGWRSNDNVKINDKIDIKTRIKYRWSMSLVLLTERHFARIRN